MAAPTNKKTSATGFVSADPSGDSARLWDYDIDGDQPKTAHLQFVDGIVARIRQKPSGPWKIWLGGFADTLGDAGYNKALAKRRVAAIEQHIRRRLPAGANVVFDRDWFGEDRTPGPDNAATAEFRAVDVGLSAAGAPPPPKPPRPVIPPLPPLPKTPGIFVRPPRLFRCVGELDCPPATSFSLTILFGTSVGELFEVARSEFLIRDIQNKLEVIYTASTGGVAISPTPIGVSLMGQPNPFTTTHPVRVNKFGPTISIRTDLDVVIPGKSRTRIVLDYRPEGLTLPRSVVLTDPDTGISLPGGSNHFGPFSVSPSNSCGFAQASRF